MVKKRSRELLWFSFLLYFVSLLIYSVFSYALTAPNLVFSTNSTFWSFQTYMWKTFFNNRDLLSKTYFILISFSFTSYLFFVSQLLKHKIKNFKLILIIFITLITPLLISNNALSYDAFNYIFNAKMVSVYGADPHSQVALNFPDDPWTKFMHNTHTTAPYGRAWTLLSLIPYSVGFGKFIITWFVFRLFSLLPLLSFLLILWKYQKRVNHLWTIFVIFNPLILIEVISNFHNDFWMITPSILSLLILDSKNKTRTSFIVKAIVSLFLLGISIWIKLATVILIPIWLMLFSKSKLIIIPRFSQIIRNWPLLASIGMFVPLLTLRSQQFHPWYLVWTIAFIPFFLKNKLSRIWALGLLVLSVSSMYRYLPFLYHNNYDGNVLVWQKAITFTPFVIVLLLSLRKLFTKSK